MARGRGATVTMSPAAPGRSDMAGPGGHHDLSDQALVRLFGIAHRAALAQLSRSPSAGHPPLSSARTAAWTVNVTLLLHGELRGSMTGQGTTLAEAVAAGARRAVCDPRWGPALTRGDIAAVTIELWVRTGVEPLSPHRALASFDLGVDGVRLRRGGHSAYYKPSVPLTAGVTRPVPLLRRLVRKAGLHGDVWCQTGTELYRTTWQNYLENGALPSGAARLHRLRPAVTPPVTSTELEHRIGLAGDRMIATQDETGRFMYLYHPFTGRRPRWTSMVRQAGTAYALAMLGAAGRVPGCPAGAGYSADRTAAWQAGALRAIHGLLRDCRTAPDGTAYLAAPQNDSAGPGTLGAVALLLRALQCAANTDQFAAHRRLLTNAILSAQQADGSFCPGLAGITSGRSGGQNFYPGEALLALCHEAALGRADCAAAISRSFGFYRRHFQHQPDPGFILWQADVWARACRLAGQGVLAGPSPARCADFVFEMADWLLPFQHHSAYPADFVGGFRIRGAPPGFSTAMYTEAIVRACQIARLGRDDGRAECYRLAAISGLRFLFRLQVTPEMAPLFRAPRLAVGGTTRTLIDFTMRTDFDQHTCTALLAARQASITE